MGVSEHPHRAFREDASVGISVGIFVGISVGISVGSSVGIAEGVRLVGISVGDSVGISVGASVRSNVGSPVGSPVGLYTHAHISQWSQRHMRFTRSIVSVQFICAKKRTSVSTAPNITALPSWGGRNHPQLQFAIAECKPVYVARHPHLSSVYHDLSNPASIA